ncbi:YciI family protein [Nocardioides sp.]|uniref:YciI family protein n=1 Tax=Nocardioides sp. TaxID=35761 RepID=UPI003D13807E
MTSIQHDLNDGLVFVLVVTYTAPLSAIDAMMPAHRRFLDEHFAAGEFLASGPRAPRTGGVIIARAADRDAIWALIAADPFTRDGLATYDVHAFLPTRGPFALPLRDSTAPVRAQPHLPTADTPQSGHLALQKETTI